MKAEHDRKPHQLGIFSDCPQRDERLGWMNDATVRFEETPCNFDTGAMFPKTIRDISDGQSPNGCISSTAPFATGNTVTDPLSCGFPVALRLCVSHLGDISVIEEFYGSLSARTNFVLSRSDGYICNYTCNGDWLHDTAGSNNCPGAVRAHQRPEHELAQSPDVRGFELSFFAYLCGVKPIKTGYNEMLIKP